MSAELWIRLGCFLGVLLVMTGWEYLSPKRSNRIAKALRWRTNFSMVVVSSVLLRLLIPAGAIGAALWAETNSFGVLHSLNVSTAVAMVIGFLLLDVAIYWQHRLFHRVPWLWRLHRVHHADLDFDVSTGLRFHPIEILLSMLIKIAVVIAFGIPAIAVLIFEVVLNATSLFNHGNVALPRWLEKPVRMFIVTQEMHRIHHSQRPVETDSNFSFNFSLWDRLFGTYTAQSKDGSDGINIGLKEYENEGESAGFWALLTNPFRPTPTRSTNVKSNSPTTSE
ncbi:sterol desaturase [Pseudidiomarina aestuarii]|uniref:Sterol desaturase n=1 Tax=Pseudidiomarina aestuarii TaxID=624146 RepID=A0A7Z7ETG6_9GAMM|nr:sterol desaturase family protein [Pseudidiomarina aestuarii]RUO41005.1 sterol desaturase [Pseudidiomarina aestuarii]